MFLPGKRRLLTANAFTSGSGTSKNAARTDWDAAVIWPPSWFQSPEKLVLAMPLASNPTETLGVPLRLTVSFTAVTEAVVWHSTVAAMAMVPQFLMPSDLGTLAIM